MQIRLTIEAGQFCMIRCGKQVTLGKGQELGQIAEIQRRRLDDDQIGSLRPPASSDEISPVQEPADETVWFYSPNDWPRHSVKASLVAIRPFFPEERT